MADHGWVRVNVGGCRFETTRETLRRVTGSMLERMFDPANKAQRTDADGCYTIPASHSEP